MTLYETSRRKLHSRILFNFYNKLWEINGSIIDFSKSFFQGQNWNHSSFWDKSFPWCWICPSKLVNRILRTVTRSMQIVIASLYKAPFFKSVWVLSLKRCTKTSKIPAITYKEDILYEMSFIFGMNTMLNIET